MLRSKILAAMVKPLKVMTITIIIRLLLQEPTFASLDMILPLLGIHALS